MKPVRILIVDDHSVVRTGVRQILTTAFPKATLADVGSAQEASNRLNKQKWDIVILDLNMPGRGGLDFLKEIKRDHPKTAVIILTMHSVDQFAVRAFRDGASSYLTKDVIDRELLDAVKAAADGKKHIPSSVAQELARYVEIDETRPAHQTLSDREYQVLCMLAAGNTVKEISAQLSLSVKTVSTYRTRIREKTQMRNNAEMMRYAMAHHLPGFGDEKAHPLRK